MSVDESPSFRRAIVCVRPNISRKHKRVSVLSFPKQLPVSNDDYFKNECNI